MFMEAIKVIVATTCVCCGVILAGMVIIEYVKQFIDRLFK